LFGLKVIFCEPSFNKNEVIDGLAKTSSTETKPKSLAEQLEERVQQLDAQRKQIEMGYAEVLGALSEARRILTMIQPEKSM